MPWQRRSDETERCMRRCPLAHALMKIAGKLAPWGWSAPADELWAASPFRPRSMFVSPKRACAH